MQKAQIGPFHHCPRCGTAGISFDGTNRFECRSCGFVYFHNTATGCGAILEIADRPGQVLLLRRGSEPMKGYLDYPGGFVDPGESLEEALLREIREETGLTAHDLRYLTSAANRYEYRDILYTTCDVIFTGIVDTVPQAVQVGEIAGFESVDPAEIDLGEIAFPSLRTGMERYRSQIGR